jgi:hypothetical protein
MSYADLGLHFVLVRHGTSRELWVTAGPRKEAVANVLRNVSPGHVAELSDRRITAEEAVHLKLKNGEARGIRPFVSSGPGAKTS